MSLDEAGGVLALVDYEEKVTIYKVNTNKDKDEVIDFDKGLVLNKYHANRVMLLEDSILTIETLSNDDKYVFYKLNMESLRAELLSGKEFDGKDFKGLSYHVGNNLVAGFVQRERQDKYGIADVLPFIGETKFLALSPLKIGGMFAGPSFKVSQNLNYMLIYSNNKWLSPRGYVYQISTDPEGG